MDFKTYYRRNLPHIQPVGESFFVTFRLKDSIPQAILYQLRKAYEARINEILSQQPENSRALIDEGRKRSFARYDQLLDSVSTGPHFLRQPAIAKIVAEQLHRFNGDLYDLSAYCIMSNHVHLLLDTSIQIPKGFDDSNFEKLDFKPLDYMLFRIKGASSRFANQLLGRQGKKFWQRESYDHYVRDMKEFGRIVDYILNNPVKAGIVAHWEDYPFSYVKSL